MALKLGAATLNQTPLDWENNSRRIREAISLGKEQGVDLLCLQELTITSYGCQDMFLANWVVEKAKVQLLKLIPDTDGIAVAIGLPWEHHGTIYNCIALISNGRFLGVSAKQNLPGDGVYYEPRWFTPWPAGKRTSITIDGEEVPFGDIIYDFQGLKLAFEICEDAWRGDDRPACRYVEMGVDLVLNPSASHFEFGKAEYRENLTVDSSKKFDCAYVFTNQCGNEAGRLIYEGDMVIARKGELLAKNQWLSFQEVQVLSVDLDAPGISSTPEANRNAIFPKAASIALYDYLRKSRSKGFTISLSGGADSACCAVLVAEMVKRGVDELGAEQFLLKLGISSDDKTIGGITNELLTCVYQATKNSSDVTRSAAGSLANQLGARYFEWNIDGEVGQATSKVEEALGRSLSWDTDDLALQNIQARMRSPLIWFMANLNNHLLITTSNRNEGDVGYATMDGDTSGGLAPIADIDKPFLRKWLKYAESELGYSSLKEVNEQQPTAELRPGHQTDEGDLMPYDLLLAIEKKAIHEKLSPLEIYNELKREMDSPQLKENISRFFRMWSASQWKRERIAPSFHFDHFSIDPKSWMRFPILSNGFKDDLEDLMNS